MRAESDVELNSTQIKKIQAKIPNIKAALQLLEDEYKMNGPKFNLLVDESYLSEA